MICPNADSEDNAVPNGALLCWENIDAISLVADDCEQREPKKPLHELRISHPRSSICLAIWLHIYLG
jgi:hypothetical protein